MASRLKDVDAVMVGMGWTGSILARELTEAGLTVVGLERGPDRVRARPLVGECHHQPVHQIAGPIGLSLVSWTAPTGPPEARPDDRLRAEPGREPPTLGHRNVPPGRVDTPATPYMEGGHPGAARVHG
jgi:choline dehydrogenase-like flavoprotein